MDHYVIAMVVVPTVIALLAFFTWWLGAQPGTHGAFKAAPLRRACDVVEGELVRVIGSAEAAELIESPLMGRPCSCWRVVVRERRRRGQRTEWVTIVDEQESVDFLLAGDVTVLVETDHIDAVLDMDKRLWSGVMRDATPELEGFLVARGHVSRGLLFNKYIRYQEGVIEPGETVVVVGVGSWEADPERASRAGPGYREAERPKRLVLRSPDGGPLLVSDRSLLTR